MIDINNEDLREAIELFYFGYRAFTEGPDRILNESKLGRVHHRILYFVGRHPGLSVNELLATLAVSKQALNAPLRKLQALGLVEAGQDAEDKRVKQLTLSAKGKALEARLTKTQMTQLSAVFSQYDEQTLRHWMEIMQKLAGQ